MFGFDASNAILHWPFLPTLVRLLLALGTGVFVGLEREHRGKAGARTFTFASLIGCLGGLLGDSYALLTLALVGLFICFLNYREWKLHGSLLLTTSMALIVVTFCGVLAGKGHTFTPVATAVISAALLAWKEPISGFATGLNDNELRSAVLLAILSFIVYPVLPPHPIDPYGLIQLQETWAIVLLIAGLGFVNYVLWKIYGPRSIDITSFLGGLVNSTAAVAELSNRVREVGEAFSSLAYRGVLLATGAMLLRNSVLLAILSVQAFTHSLIPLLTMLGTSGILLLTNRREVVATPSAPPPDLKLEQPFSLKAALKFGFIFLGLSTAGLLAQRSLGVFGFYAVSVAGGLLSSASAVAAAGIAATHHEIQFPVAANGAVLASLTSALINIPLIARSGGQPRLTKAIARALLIVIALGVVGLLVRKPLEMALRPVLQFHKASAASANSLGKAPL
jgi:uncharacterized membrane protein (DUF4010 family)